MTTEIAVLNRLGIALAADSAITISGFGSDKVFDTGDKLFELSCEHPVAAMVNGNMDFLGVPWEIIIKQFRDRSSPDNFDTIEEWAASFLEHVLAHKAVKESHTDAWVRQFAVDYIEHLKQRVSDEHRRLFATDDLAEFDADRLKNLLHEYIIKLSDEASYAPPLTSMMDVNRDDLSATLSPIFSDLQRAHFGSLGPDVSHSDMLNSALVGKLVTEIARDSQTGIVICGFGKEKLFPYLYAIAIDGVVAGRLRYHVTHRVEITRSADGAPDGPRKELGTAISFAQTDVIERLLRGSDERFVTQTKDFIRDAVEGAIRHIFTENSLRIIDDKENEINLESLAQAVANGLPEQYGRYAAKQIGDAIELEFKRTIALMPKQELIELAEALVSITAVERKATSDAGTVGGPVDVALITRSEGFVWIKRKHYFQSELNPRYLTRVQSRAKGGEGR